MPLFASKVNSFTVTSQSTHKRNQILLLLVSQLCAQHEVKVFHGVIQRQQSSVMHIRRRVLDATEREGLDSAVARHHHTVHHMLLVEALRLQVVHSGVCEIWARVALSASAFAEEDLLPM